MDKLNKTKLLKLYPEYNKVYGPYTRKDNRKHIILTSSDPYKKRTVSYPKALVEIREGRLLTYDETVDHDDQDFTNNLSSNLIIRLRIDHAKLDAERLEPILAPCAYCSKEFKLSRNQINTRASRHAGPFCSPSCSGKYGSEVRANKIIAKDRASITKKYYCNKLK